MCRRAREPFWDIPVPKMTALGDKYAFGARTGLRSPRHATTQRVMATIMPLRLSLFPHVVYTCAIAHIPTKQGNLGYPGGLPATARFRVALLGGRQCYMVLVHPCTSQVPGEAGCTRKGYAVDCKVLKPQQHTQPEAANARGRHAKKCVPAPTSLKSKSSLHT